MEKNEITKTLERELDLNMVSNKNDLAQKSVSEDFKNAKQDVFTSIADDGSIETKAKVFNAMNDTDYALRDYIGKKIFITDFVAHKIKMEDEKTGEITYPTRCIFIDKDGKTYGTVSTGINQSMIKLFATVGFPDTWEKPIPIKVIEKSSRKGYRFLTISLSL